MNPASGSAQLMRAQTQGQQRTLEPATMLSPSPAAPAPDSPEPPRTSPELAVSALSENDGKANTTTLAPLREGLRDGLRDGCVLPPFMSAAAPLGPAAPLPGPATLTSGPPPAAQPASPPTVHSPVSLERAATRRAAVQQPRMVSLPSGNPTGSGSRAPLGQGEFICKYEDCRRAFRRKTSLTNHTKAHLNKNSRSILRMKRMKRQEQARQRLALETAQVAVNPTLGPIAGSTSGRALKTVSPMAMTTSVAPMSLSTSVAPLLVPSPQPPQPQPQMQQQHYLLPSDLPSHPSLLVSPYTPYLMPGNSAMGMSGTSSLAASQYGHGMGPIGSPDDESTIVNQFAHGLGRDDVHSAMYQGAMAPPQWPPDPAPVMNSAGGLMSSGFTYDLEAGAGTGPSDALPFAALQDDQPGQLANERLDTQYLNSFEPLQQPNIETMKHLVLPDHPAVVAPEETSVMKAEPTPAPSPGRTD